MVYQFAFGPRIRKSPFFDATVKAGVTHFSSYNRVCFPVSYGDTLAEYKRLTEGVSMWDVSVERQIRFRGPDALTLLRVLWARAIAHERGMNVIVDEADVNPMAVQGPKAVNVLTDLFGDWVQELKYFGFQNAFLGDIPVIVAKSGWSKQGGYEIYLLDSTRGTDLWNAVEEAGAAYEIGPGAPNYIERIESGLLSMGADTDDRTNPFEVGLGRLVDVDQDQDFIGKQALTRIKAEGAQRKLVGYYVDGENFQGSNGQPWDVLKDEQLIGRASAGAYSPRLDRNIALGLIDIDHALPGTEVVIETEHGTRSATVTNLPFTIS